MQVTNEMVEVAARATCAHGGFDPDERMSNDGPRWRYYLDGARAALTAALSAEQTRPVAVKALGWVTCGEVSFSSTPFGSYEIRENTPRFANDAFELVVAGEKIVSASFATEVLARSAAQADYETRIRSALVDVPAEPVAKQWCAYEDGHQHTSWYPDGYGDRAGWEALAKRNPAKYHVATRDLFTSPPLSREGEDAAEVERLKKELTAAYGEFNRIACEGVTETRSIADALDRCHLFANRGATTIRVALAATRSGSATASKGQADE